MIFVVITPQCYGCGAKYGRCANAIKVPATVGNNGKLAFVVEHHDVEFAEALALAQMLFDSDCKFPPTFEDVSLAAIQIDVFEANEAKRLFNGSRLHRLKALYDECRKRDFNRLFDRRVFSASLGVEVSQAKLPVSDFFGHAFYKAAYVMLWDKDRLGTAASLYQQAFGHVYTESFETLHSWPFSVSACSDAYWPVLLPSFAAVLCLLENAADVYENSVVVLKSNDVVQCFESLYQLLSFGVNSPFPETYDLVPYNAQIQNQTCLTAYVGPTKAFVKSLFAKNSEVLSEVAHIYEEKQFHRLFGDIHTVLLYIIDAEVNCGRVLELSRRLAIKRMFRQLIDSSSQYLPNLKYQRAASAFDVQNDRALGNSVLHSILTKPSVLLDDILLQSGHVNVRNALGMTPLFELIAHWLFLTWFSHETGIDRLLLIIQTLLDNGADPNIPDVNGDTIIHYLVKSFATDCTHVMFCIVRVLAAHGANPNILDLEGRAPFYTAVDACLTGSRYVEESVDLLLEIGADPNAGLFIDLPIEAVVKGGIAGVRFAWTFKGLAKLFKAGADPCYRNNNVFRMLKNSGTYSLDELSKFAVLFAAAGCKTLGEQCVVGPDTDNHILTDLYSLASCPSIGGLASRLQKGPISAVIEAAVDLIDDTGLYWVQASIYEERQWNPTPFSPFFCKFYRMWTGRKTLPKSFERLYVNKLKSHSFYNAIYDQMFGPLFKNDGRLLCPPELWRSKDVEITTTLLLIANRLRRVSGRSLQERDVCTKRGRLFNNVCSAQLPFIQQECWLRIAAFACRQN